MNFFNDYEKLHPVDPKPDAAAAGASNVNSLTVDDMKSYMDQMKETMLGELKKEIANISIPKEKEGDNNASSTDLSSGESDSSESAVDR